MRWILTIVFVTAFFASPLFAKELTGTLQQIQKSGKVKIGYRDSLPPMSFLDKAGQPVGYSLDLCGHIVSEIEKTIGTGIKVEYVPVTAENRFAALPENKIDILCGATTKTISRGEMVDFTQLTFVTGASFMSRKGTKIRNNFSGKKIGVVKDTTTAVALKKLLQETKTEAEVVFLNSSAEALKAMEQGKIDTYSADQVVLIGLAITAEEPDRFSVLPDLFTYEPFALAVRRNDADFRLVADRVIADLYRSRKILDIYDRWLGQFSSGRSTAFDALIQLNAIPE